MCGLASSNSLSLTEAGELVKRLLVAVEDILAKCRKVPHKSNGPNEAVGTETWEGEDVAERIVSSAHDCAKRVTAAALQLIREVLNGRRWRRCVTLLRTRNAPDNLYVGDCCAEGGLSAV